MNAPRSNRRRPWAAARILTWCLFACLALDTVSGAEGRRTRRSGKRSPLELSEWEKRELDRLTAKALAWAKSAQRSTNSVSPDSVADFFGLRAFRTAQFLLRAGQKEPSTNLYAQAGMAFLSTLNQDQMKILTKAADEQAASVARHRQAHAGIQEQLSRGQVQFPSHEEQLLRLTKERRLLEGSAGLAQAIAFRELALTMNRAQLEYLGNFRRGLTADAFVAYGAGEAADLNTRLKGLSEDNRSRLLETAEEAFNWLIGSLADNLAMETSEVADFFREAEPLPNASSLALPQKSTDRTGKYGKTGNPFAGLTGTLDWRQRRVVMNLLREEKPLLSRFVSDRKKLVPELYRLRTSGSVAPRLIAALSERLGETEGRLAILQAKAFSYLETILRPEQLTKVTIPSIRRQERSQGAAGANNETPGQGSSSNLTQTPQ